MRFVAKIQIVCAYVLNQIFSRIVVMTKILERGTILVTWKSEKAMSIPDINKLPWFLKYLVGQLCHDVES